MPHSTYPAMHKEGIIMTGNLGTYVDKSNYVHMSLLGTTMNTFRQLVDRHVQDRYQPELKGFSLGICCKSMYFKSSLHEN
jgi:hypothetical protein